MSHPSLFREYDIRGVVGDTLFATDAYAIGSAFAAKAAEVKANPLVCVGYDGRLSSPEMQQALCAGLEAGGARVRSVGLGPTPMLYYATCVENAAAGVMVTGSHNPPDHNGFKFMLGGKPFFGAAIQELRAAIAANDGLQMTNDNKSDVIRHPSSVIQIYTEALLTAYNGKRELRVAWDAGNGAAGEVMQALCDKLPGEHISLNATIDGTFPVHHPDPTVPKNLEQIIACVRDNKLDCGIAFDGDGDRIGVVDDEGEILWGDQLLAIYASEILARKGGETIIADVKASQMLFDEVLRLGGKPLMWKTGHSHIKAKMKELHAPLAGEMSGHIFFADEYYGFDDALYAAIRLLRILANGSEKLSDLRKRLPVFVNTPEIRFPCDDTRKFEVIKEVQARLGAESANFVDVDGVRVNTPLGWWLLRASNTQPMLVARAEARDIQGLETLKEALRKQLAASSVSLPDESASH